MTHSTPQTAKIQIGPAVSNLAAVFDRETKPAEINFWWLGQAGFAFKYQNTLLLIDPYLSDSLAEKYQHHELKHSRMMPVPVAPEEIGGCNWYLCTHGHTDHMDANTIRGVLKNSSPHFVIPRAEIFRGLERGMPADKIQPLNTGETLLLNSAISIQTIPAAHEQLEVDGEGNDRYLGYVISFDGFRVFHSGDCVLYPGLSEWLQDIGVEIAFLPVNGRDEYRLSRGIAGNFSIQEAIGLCKTSHIPMLVCHHFEMFDFNTVDRQALHAILSEQRDSLAWMLPEIDVCYTIQFALNG